MNTLFSIFGDTPDIDEISSLLKINSYYIVKTNFILLFTIKKKEIPILITNLLFNSNKEYVMSQLMKSPNLNVLCSKLNMQS